jgi:hypothetical protein
MAKRNPVLLEAALLVLFVGFVLFLNPFHNEPLWAQWLIGPVYLALPVSMVAAAVHFFRPRSNVAPPKAPTKARS